MKTLSLKDFGEIIYKILKSDRDVNLAVGGMTGEGKSCFLTKLQKAYSKVSNTSWTFENMTWQKKELMTWIDGDGPDKKGQKPEYTALMSDELFTMFYKRNWYDSDQISMIATFNMCRDRHLFVGGNVPDFWDLDSSFLKRIRFYAFIPRRGIAWVFEQENNPFSPDPWNTNQNKKLFRKNGSPYKLPNFLCEIHYTDWSDSEKKQYYEIRNKKRLLAVQDVKKNNVEKYKDIKLVRDTIIRLYFNERKELARLCKLDKLEDVKLKYGKAPLYTEMSKVLDLSPTGVRRIVEGEL